MPYIEIKTNKKLEVNQKEEIVKEVEDSIHILNKGKNWLMVNVLDNNFMSFSSSKEPCLIVEVKCYGNILDNMASQFTSHLTKELVKTVNIPSNRIYFNYFSTNEWGYDGENF